MKSFEIARRRMHNSRLTGPALDAPDEVVSRHGAMQAQDYGPAKWSIGQRAKNLIDDDIDRAVASGSLVRTHVLRPTWHFVARADVRWLLALTGPRVQRHNAPRYRDLGLDARTLSRCADRIGAALEGANHLTRDALGAILQKARVDTSGQRLPYILMHCELEAVIGSGELAGKKQTYSLLDERVPDQIRFDRDDALVELTRRYLTSHGPATTRDLGWWSSLTAVDIKRALHMLGSEVRSETIDDTTFWSVAAEADPVPKSPGVHLLQAYDELVVGYTGSRYFGDPRGAFARETARERRLPTGIVLHGGWIAGHWRRTIAKDRIHVEVHLYDDGEMPTEAPAAALKKLERFIGKPVILATTRLQSRSLDPRSS